MLAPAKTPQPIVAKLNAAVNEALRSPEIVGRAEKEAMRVTGGTPAQFSKQIQDDVVTWGRAVKRAGVALE